MLSRSCKKRCPATSSAFDNASSRCPADSDAWQSRDHHGFYRVECHPDRLISDHSGRGAVPQVPQLLYELNCELVLVGRRGVPRLPIQNLKLGHYRRYGGAESKQAFSLRSPSPDPLRDIVCSSGLPPRGDKAACYRSSSADHCLPDRGHSRNGSASASRPLGHCGRSAYLSPPDFAIYRQSLDYSEPLKRRGILLGLELIGRQDWAGNPRVDLPEILGRVVQG